MSGRALAKEIFRAPSPEEYAAELPAQSLYLALQAVGLESGAELLMLATSAQYRVFLDFDLWQGDEMSEEQVWRWLSVLDQEHGLEPLAKFVTTVDQDLLALLVQKYVEAVFPDEPTEQPPEAGFYTPDRGNTWVRILIAEPEKLRIFGKVLALLYETDTERYYQLLAHSGYGTAIELQEEAYQRKCRRLQDEGIPDPETSFHVNSPLNPSSLNLESKAAPETESTSASVSRAVVPLAFGISFPQPLGSALSEICIDDDRQGELESELALIANAAFVAYGIDYNDYDAVRFMLEKIRGAINLGLESLMRRGSADAAHICQSVGLQKLYRVGLFELRALTAAANRAEPGDGVTELIVQAATQPFPDLPKCVGPDGKLLPHVDATETDRRPITHLVELEAAMNALHRSPATESETRS